MLRIKKAMLYSNEERQGLKQLVETIGGAWRETSEHRLHCAFILNGF